MPTTILECTSRRNSQRPSFLARQVAALGLLLASTAAAYAQTTTFSYTGTPQTYTVPAGVTRLQVVATGGSGGTVFGNTSKGALVTATITVTAQEVLTVTVGGSAPSGASYVGSGGYNGGGTGGGTAAGGGGGGATDLRRSGASTGDYLTTRNAILVAAGGGGNGSDGGMGGSADNFNGANGGGDLPGQGASQSQAGQGGANGGTAGSTSRGGNGASRSATAFHVGGGGGGGYYGGGGGGLSSGTNGSGGGAGSSWVMAGSSDVTCKAAPVASVSSLIITPVSVLAVAPRFDLSSGQVALYPNPAKASAFVTLSNTLGNQAVTATLGDALGRVMRTVLLPAQGAEAHQLDLHELPTGVYCLRLNTSAGTFVKRIVIE